MEGLDQNLPVDRLPVYVAPSLPQTLSEAEFYGLAGLIDTCPGHQDNSTSGTTGNGRWPTLHVVYRWRRISKPASTPFVVVLRTVESRCTQRHVLAPIGEQFFCVYSLHPPTYVCLSIFVGDD